MILHQVDLLPSSLEKPDVEHCVLGGQTRHAIHPRCEYPRMKESPIGEILVDSMFFYSFVNNLLCFLVPKLDVRACRASSLIVDESKNIKDLGRVSSFTIWD